MTTEQPLFSIITVCYNAESTIERTILSIAKQSFRNLEYIIIDGKSTDDTLSIIKKYEADITKFVSEKDTGLYHAMNKGIKLATGKYLCFLNAGDKFHLDNTLELIAQQIMSLHYFPDVIYGETAIVNNNGRFLRMRRLSAPNQLNWKSFKKGMLVCHQAFMPKREIAPLYEQSYLYSSDFDWCIKILKIANHTYNTKLITIDYLNEGLTTSNHKKSLLERFYIMTNHYGFISTIIYHLWFILRSLFKK